MLKRKEILIILFILLGILSRLIPHPPNFTALASIALFSGAYLKNKYLSVSIPLVIMIISDTLIGLPKSSSVYISFILITLLGHTLQTNRTKLKIINFSILSSILFFIITNLFVFLQSEFYPKNIIGIIECYVFAIPFFTNTLLSTLIYSLIIFISFEKIQKTIFIKFEQCK